MLSLGRWILVALSGSIVPLGLKLIAGLGVGVLVYSQLDDFYAGLVLQIQAQFDALPAAAVIIDMLGFREAISVLLSAIAVRMTLAGVNWASGTLTRAQWVPPSV